MGGLAAQCPTHPLATATAPAFGVNMASEKLTLPWVLVAPDGVAYVGLHDDEAGAWSIALGWPSDQEIEDHKRAGWYAAQATMTWKKPDHRSNSGTKPERS